MEIMEVMEQRHSVRQYLDKPAPEDIRKKLQDFFIHRVPEFITVSSIPFEN